jgi:hypothetical protein
MQMRLDCIRTACSYFLAILKPVKRRAFQAVQAVEVKAGRCVFQMRLTLNLLVIIKQRESVLLSLYRCTVHGGGCQLFTRFGAVNQTHQVAPGPSIAPSMSLSVFNAKGDTAPVSWIVRERIHSEL